MKRYINGLFAISEIAAILIAGSILGGLSAQLLLGALGYDLSSINETEMLMTPSYDGALISAITIGSRFFWLLLIAFLVLRFIHQTKPRDVGVSTGGHSWAKLAGAGLLLFAVGSLPFKAVLLGNEFLQFGQGIEAWQYFSGQTITLAYILMMLASLVLLPPLFEEPFARGYMRFRLAKAYAPVGGVILAGVFFMGAHGHFYESDPVVVLSFIALIFGAICWTWTTYRMGSIVPAFVAHSLTNLPLPVEATYLLPTVAVMVAIIVFKGKFLVSEFAAFFSELKAAPHGLPIFGLIVIVSFLAPIVFFGDLVVVLGIVALLLALTSWLPPVKRWLSGEK